MTPELTALVESLCDWTLHAEKSCLELPADVGYCYCGLTTARHELNAALREQAREIERLERALRIFDPGMNSLDAAMLTERGQFTDGHGNDISYLVEENR